MSDLRKRISAKPLRVSAGGLKYFSAVLMLLVNANTVILEKGILGLDAITTEELIAAMEASSRLTALVGVASIIRLLSGVIVPIFTFLLVEGFVHTGSYGNYLKAVAVTALISEPVYDYAIHGSLLEFSQQNPVFALVISLAMLAIIRMIGDKSAGARWIKYFLVVLCAAFWVVLLRVEFGLEIILLAAIFYCFRERTAVKTILGVLVSVMDPLGPFAFCALVYYNGKRTLKIHKYVFYALYPLHMLVLGIVSRMILR